MGLGRTSPGPLAPGDPVPEIRLPAVHEDGEIGLGDVRGRSAVLVAINRGLYCPFCRRYIAQVAAAWDRLLALGVETLAVTTTPLERARLFFRFRTTPLPLLSGPDLVSHQGFGFWPGPLPAEKIAQWTSSQDRFAAIRPLPEIPSPPGWDEQSTEEVASYDRKIAGWPTPAAQFLVDRGGVVRWVSLEADGTAAAARCPSNDEMVAAAQALP